MAPHARPPRLELLVTDPAGNVVRRAARLRVRIAHRPLLSYRVGPRHDFAMFIRAGDRAVGRFVNALIAGLASGDIGSMRELRRRYVEGIGAIDAAGHDEIWDSAVIDEIFAALFVPLARRGYDAESLVTI